MELAEAMCEDYMPKLMRTINEQCQHTKEDFYIEVLQKHERVLEKAFRPHIMICHGSCPKPNPDQTLFRYNQKEGRIELIWVLPPEDAIVYLLENFKSVHADEQQLLNFCVGARAAVLESSPGSSSSAPSARLNSALTKLRGSAAALTRSPAAPPRAPKPKRLSATSAICGSRAIFRVPFGYLALSSAYICGPTMRRSA